MHSLRSCLVAVLATVGMAGATQARDLTVVSWGGAYQQTQRDIFFQPYSRESGAKVVDDSWDGGIGLLRTRAEGPNGSWDVVQVEGEDLLLGCAEGLFVKL